MRSMIRADDVRATAKKNTILEERKIILNYGSNIVKIIMDFIPVKFNLPKPLRKSAQLHHRNIQFLYLKLGKLEFYYENIKLVILSNVEHGAYLDG